MTSISSSMSTHQFLSPRDRLQNELTTHATAGTVKSEDVQALTTALDDIDASLSAERTSAGSGARPSPSELTDKVNDLIDGLVDKGKLTDDQAEELKGVFASALPQGGPPPGPPPGGGASGKETDSSKLLSDSLKLLQESNAQSTGYGANGSSTNQPLDPSLIFSIQA
jgi:hypothetical protein